MSMKILTSLMIKILIYMSPRSYGDHGYSLDMDLVITWKLIACFNNLGEVGYIGYPN